MRTLKTLPRHKPGGGSIQGFSPGPVIGVAFLLFLSVWGFAPEARATEHESTGFGIGEESFGPDLQIKGFGDINFVSEEGIEGEPRKPNTFSLGQLDLFMTSELTAKSHFLLELVFEGDEENELETDLERVVFQYSLNDRLKAEFGRMHTDFGFFNHEYHHGRWFLTSAFRPKFFGFEDEQGLLPIHSTGIYFHGMKDFRFLDLKYGLGISNGRGKRRNEIQAFQDANDFKAVNTQLRLSPDAVPGLSFGFSTYFDRIPPDPSDPLRTDEIKESIWGGFLAYHRRGIEIINEFAWISHQDMTTGRDFDSVGYYLQVSYGLGPFRPYYRLEYSDLDPFNPYWSDLDQLQEDYTANLIGIKWNVNIWSAVKAEFRHNNFRALSNTNDFFLQLSFTF